MGSRKKLSKLALYFDVSSWVWIRNESFPLWGPETKSEVLVAFRFLFHVTGIFLSNRKVLWKGLRFISFPFELHWYRPKHSEFWFCYQQQETRPAISSYKRRHNISLTTLLSGTIATKNLTEVYLSSWREKSLKDDGQTNCSEAYENMQASIKHSRSSSFCRTSFSASLWRSKGSR